MKKTILLLISIIALSTSCKKEGTKEPEPKPEVFLNGTYKYYYFEYFPDLGTFIEIDSRYSFNNEEKTGRFYTEAYIPDHEQYSHELIYFTWKRDGTSLFIKELGTTEYHRIDGFRYVDEYEFYEGDWLYQRE